MKTNAVSLSLGIPVYNQAGTIEQTIASVLAQTAPFDEVVVVDNHSTDGTSERLAAFSDRVRVIRPPQHLSMSENWNFCVGAMGSDWFSLLSGDDLLKPGFAERVRQAIAAHRDAVLVRTDWDVIDGEGKIKIVHHQLSVSRITKPPKTWQEQLYGPKVSFAAFACRKDAWKKVGGFPDDFHLIQDWIFWLKVGLHGDFIKIPESLSQYRVVARPELQSKRAPLFLMDYCRYFLDTIPSFPCQPRLEERTIKSVRRSGLNYLLNYLCDYPFVIDDPECRNRLRELAAASSMTATYERWLQMPAPPPPPIRQMVRTRVASLIRRVLSLRYNFREER